MGEDSLRKRKPTPIDLLRKPHEQRSQAGYNPECCKESDMTEDTHTHTHTHRYIYILYCSIAEYVKKSEH